MDRFIEFLKGFISGNQCCHASQKEDTKDGSTTYFCVRRIGHFGHHKKGSGDVIEHTAN